MWAPDKLTSRSRIGMTNSHGIKCYMYIRDLDKTPLKFSGN